MAGRAPRNLGLPRDSSIAVLLALTGAVACGGEEESKPPLDLRMTFVRIPAGSFDMGSDSKRAFDQHAASRKNAGIIAVTLVRPVRT